MSEQQKYTPPDAERFEVSKTFRPKETLREQQEPAKKSGNEEEKTREEEKFPKGETKFYSSPHDSEKDWQEMRKR